MANIFSNLPVPAGNGSGAAVDTSTMGRERTVTVLGSFTGVIDVEFTNDTIAGPYIPLITFSAPGETTIPIAAQFMRVSRRGFAGGGTPNVDVSSNDVGGLFFDLPATALNGTGASVDVSTLGTYNTITAQGDFNGVVLIEISADGTDWAELLTFTGPGFKSMDFVAQFMRVVRKGATAGTVDIDVGAVNDTTAGGGGGGGPSALEMNVRAENTTPIAAAFNDLIAADSSGGAIVVNLPAIAADNIGQQIAIKESDGVPTSITATPAVGQTVDSAASFIISVANQSITLMSDGGTNWLVI